MNTTALSPVTSHETKADRYESAMPAALEHVPQHQRHRILAGMRWSFWLSTVAVGFGAAINFLLARVGPETLAVYGLLSVYIGLLTSFFYFGGDTVIIKFSPECRPEDRSSFIVSYLAIILTFLIPFLLLGYWWPSLVRMILGRDLDDRAAFFLLALAPVPITFQVAIAALKGMLEIKASQALSKSLSLMSLCAYCALVFTAPAFLKSYPRTVIWGIYLGLAAVAAAAGGILIYRSSARSRLHFYLPTGFWRYAVDTQMVSVSTFLSGRLDYMCLLNFGTLATLGRYVAVVTVAMTVTMISTLFMDTLLPSLTNMVAIRNERAAAQVFSVHMRILFLVTAAVSIGIMVMSVYVCRLLGPQYSVIGNWIVAAAMFQGLSVPGTYGGTLLASVGQQRPATLVSVLKAVFFGAIFLALQSRSLLGAAVIGSGVAAVAGSITLMTVGRIRAPFFPSVSSLWIKAGFIESTVAATTLHWTPPGLFTGLAIWSVAMVALLFLGGYSLNELLSLSRIFLVRSKSAEATALSC